MASAKGYTMADTDQNVQVQLTPQAQPSSSQGGNAQQQPAAQGPVAPSADMYDPRLLVDVIRSGQPDITPHVIQTREQK
jgi:hypothetical protein